MSNKDFAAQPFGANINLHRNHDPGQVHDGDKPKRTVNFADSPMTAIEEKISKVSNKVISNRDLTSSHDLFFESPDYQVGNKQQSLFCYHFMLHWRTFFSLIIEVILIVLRFILDIIVMVFKLIWLILRSILQIILCIILATYFALTSCCPGNGLIFKNDHHLQDLREIRWKNIHKLYLFLKIEAGRHPASASAGLRDGVPKSASPKDVLKQIPVANILKVVSEVLSPDVQLFPHRHLFGPGAQGHAPTHDQNQAA